MDRDDVEHLFKNSMGFTFRDRKQFWNAIQKIVSTNVHPKSHLKPLYFLAIITTNES